MYKSRTLDRSVREALGAFRVVSLTGARQVGLEDRIAAVPLAVVL